MIRIPKPIKGYARQFLQCKRCKKVQYYDYIPHSSSIDIKISVCIHGISEPWYGKFAWCKYLTKDIGLKLLKKQNKERSVSTN